MARQSVYVSCCRSLHRTLLPMLAGISSQSARDASAYEHPSQLLMWQAYRWTNLETLGGGGGKSQTGRSCLAHNDAWQVVKYSCKYGSAKQWRCCSCTLQRFSISSCPSMPVSTSDFLLLSIMLWCLHLILSPDSPPEFQSRLWTLNPKICNFRIRIQISFSTDLGHYKLPLSPLVCSTLSAVEAQNSWIQWLCCHKVITSGCTVSDPRMSHRKWRETKQQLIWWPVLALLGCSLVSLHFQCDILAPITVNSLRFHRCQWSPKRS